VTEKQLTASEARELIQAEKQARIDECRRELYALLEKYHCRLDVAVILRVNQVSPQLQIIAVEDE